MLPCGEAQVFLPIAVCFHEVNPERGPITAEEWLSIPLLQVVIKHSRFFQTEEGNVHYLFWRGGCVSQFGVGDAVSDFLKERLNRGVWIVTRRHLFLILFQVKLVYGGVGCDQVVKEPPQGDVRVAGVGVF